MMEIFGDIWRWMNENSGALSAMGNWLMLLVWALYFQLILTNYRYRFRPKILVNRSSSAVESHCIITNMSAETIYLESILVELDFGESIFRHVLSDIVRDRHGRQRTRYQGPLASGEMLDIGSFRSVIERGLGSPQAQDLENGIEDIKSILITPVATYTAEDRLIGAERRFLVDARANEISSRQYSASQIRSGARQREVEQFLLKHLR
ncbi:hypothetical protein [Rhizobium sp. L1K21]|uniref:hypothetical protein n=1 Tax=Rhizobium sp. L1K21 TaxID=2954933 RepID=UPI0020939483|nr:hypothetical protein [Rhizobium sp. L1K21]MCO6187792.1 hypothetical protein [Rhizobium sp. L1K21]